MDKYPGFPNPDLDQETAEPLDYPGVLTRVQAPCLGRFENTVVLLRGKYVLQGLKKPKNVGSCLLHIACYDSAGTFIGTYHQEMSFLRFPSNTDVVRLGCARDCAGTAVLEYLDPNTS